MRARTCNLLVVHILSHPPPTLHLHHPKRAAAAAAAAAAKKENDLKLVEEINAAAKDAVDGLIDADGKRSKWGKEGRNSPFGNKADKDRAVSELLESNLDQLQKLEEDVARKICIRFVDLKEVKLPRAK